MTYGGGFLYKLVFTEWRLCVSQNGVLGRGCYITSFSPSDVTAFHRIWVESGMIIIIYGLALSNWSIRTYDQVVNHVYTSDHVVILGAAMCLFTHNNLNILIQPTAADTRRSINVGLKLGQRRRRWTNVKPTMIERLVSAGRPLPYQTQDIDPKSK